MADLCGRLIQRHRLWCPNKRHTTLPLIGSRRESFAGAAREGVFLCTDKTRRWFAPTATRSLRSPRASSSSTQTVSSASRVAAHRAAQPRRLLGATAPVAATRAAAAHAAAIRAARARCSAQPAPAAAARPRSPSARAARSRSTAAIASPASVRAAAPTNSLYQLEGAREIGLLLDSPIGATAGEHGPPRVSPPAFPAGFQPRQRETWFRRPKAACGPRPTPRSCQM